MTADQLVAEGRRLQRPTIFLYPHGTGRVAAFWHECNAAEIKATGRRCWLTIDSRHVPSLSPTLSGYLTVFTDETKCRGGHVELISWWPDREGTPLYAEAKSVLPPVDAVFARGSDAVGNWLCSNGWNRHDRYNDNFKGAAVVEEYDHIWKSEYPLYLESDVYAVLGGWHWPCAHNDWHDLMSSL